MGLGELDRSSEKGSADEIFCSICLDVVRIGGGRSTAKLQCSHEFHLDCIGSAFNAKGVMQCPNCREIGKGSWLYSNGSRSLPDRSIDEWTQDEDLYDFNYSEMPFGVHWCPFSRLARLLPPFEEGESPPAIAFQDLVGYHAMFTGDPPISAENHYDGPTIHHHHWSHHQSRQIDGQTPGVVPHVDLHYHNWEHRSPIYSQPSSHSSGSNQDTDSTATSRLIRLDASDFLPMPVSSAHHFAPGHGSSSRSTSSFAPTPAPPPPYFTNSQSYPHAGGPYQHQNPPQRSGGRNLPASVPHPPFDAPTYYLFPPTASSSRNPQESVSTRGYTWGREHFSPEASWWGPLPQSTGLTYSRDRWGFWHRNHSERPSSQGRAEGSSYRPSPVSRMRPYN